MENDPQTNSAPAAPQQHASMRVMVTALVVVAIAVGALYAYHSFLAKQTTQMTEGAQQAFVAYNDIATTLDFAEGDENLVAALTSFRDIAANEQNSNQDRARALNGINYAYTQSDYSADDVYNIVFSKAPFNAYYKEPAAVAVDPLHPEAGNRVQAVEEALLKLNELSNSLTVSHYAIVRLEINNVFAYQRASSRAPAADQDRIRKEYAEKIKTLVAQYDTLPAIETVEDYRMPMRIQILFAHASALSWVGNNLNDSEYIRKGEQNFIETMRLADSFPQTGKSSGGVRNQGLLARIFYASYHWRHYKTTDPDYMKEIVRPLMTEEAKNTAVYAAYLPEHKDAKVPPYTVLREIAAQMPEFKTFLEGRGWKF